MPTRASFARSVLGLSLALAGPVFSQTPGGPTAQIATAAEALLATLSDAQRSAALFGFDDEAQRKRWSNLPTGPFTRAGLRMGDLTEPQRAAVRALLTAALSPVGYTKVMAIVEADEQLRQSTDRAMFGRDEYYVSFVGEPSDDRAVAAAVRRASSRAEHHVRRGSGARSRRATPRRSRRSTSSRAGPCGRSAARRSWAFALLESLDEKQREQAILGFQVRDLVLGPGRDGQTIQPEGIKGSELTARQRELLLDLAGEWTGIIARRVGERETTELEAAVADTWFAWSGPVEKGKRAYFRIQGPTVHIEYAPQGRDEPTTHVHTIYRDPTNEYGARWWAR